MQTYLASNKRPSDLVQQAQIGDPGAFEILFERYSALLFPLISRISPQTMADPLVFVDLETEEMRPPRFSAFPGAGFVVAHKS